ncbi:hypothetical protein ACHAWC_009040 [Mediolabrus comicus]
MAPLTRICTKYQWNCRSVILQTVNHIADGMEGYSYQVWEDVARETNVWNDDDVDDVALHSYSQPPEIDLNRNVPCESEQRREYLLKGLHDDYNESANHTSWCKLRDVITRELLIEYASSRFDNNFDLATHPIILRNVWPPESFHDNTRKLTPQGILNDPIYSNILLPNYFHDAAQTGYNALVPDSEEITLSQFISNIQSGKAPRSKIGTQVIIEKYPELREEIINVTLAKELFGWKEDPKENLERFLGDKKTFLSKKLPSTSYYPVFIADNKPADMEEESHPRTDLHAEPIGNIAVQLHGFRKWTLVPTKYSTLLAPTVSKHGRAYMFSNIDPTIDLPKRLKSLPLVYECVTRRGDALWVPPWMWHRVDYSYTKTQELEEDFDEDDTLSFGASIFHFYPSLFIRFPLFAFLILPNLFWEVIGVNIE